MAEKDMTIASEAYISEKTNNNSVRNVFIIGDRGIIGSTPKNPVIMRTGDDP